MATNLGPLGLWWVKNGLNHPELVLCSFPAQIVCAFTPYLKDHISLLLIKGLRPKSSGYRCKTLDRPLKSVLCFKQHFGVTSGYIGVTCYFIFL